jgi:osmotically-inducible protein OsmY
LSHKDDWLDRKSMMLNQRLSATLRWLSAAVIALSISRGGRILEVQAMAAEGNVSQSGSVTTSNDSVSLEGHHHYQSPADRANDALLITEVKSALADSRIADNSPIAVDCDHGHIVLSGVMDSEESARRAGTIAAGASGVLAVKNQLTWH